MRLYEFTNAEEQLKLLQLIFDSTFSTIRQQAEQQAREKAEQSRLAKLKPKRKSSIKSKSLPSIKVSASPKPPTKPTPTQPLAKSSQPPSTLPSNTTQPPTNSPTTLPNKIVAPTALAHIKPIPPIKPTVATKYPIKPKHNRQLNPLEDDEKDSY